MALNVCSGPDSTCHRCAHAPYHGHQKLLSNLILAFPQGCSRGVQGNSMQEHFETGSPAVTVMQSHNLYKVNPYGMTTLSQAPLSVVSRIKA